MTRKDYQLIAELLKDTKESKNTITEMAKQLHHSSGYTPNGNKSFKTDVFISACA